MSFGSLKPKPPAPPEPMRAEAATAPAPATSGGFFGSFAPAKPKPVAEATTAPALATSSGFFGSLAPAKPKPVAVQVDSGAMEAYDGVEEVPDLTTSVHENGCPLRHWRQKLALALDDSYGSVEGDLLQTPLADTWSALPTAFSELVQEKVSKEEAFYLGSLRAEGRLEGMLRERCASAERRAERTAEQAWSRCRLEWQRLEASKARSAQSVEATSKLLESLKKERDAQEAEIATMRNQVEANAARWSEERASLTREREEMEEQCSLYAELESSRENTAESRQQMILEATGTIQEAIAAAKAKEAIAAAKAKDETDRLRGYPMSGDASPLPPTARSSRSMLNDLPSGARSPVLSVLMGSERSRPGTPVSPYARSDVDRRRTVASTLSASEIGTPLSLYARSDMDKRRTVSYAASEIPSSPGLSPSPSRRSLAAFPSPMFSGSSMSPSLRGSIAQPRKIGFR